jgi:hypothetical protein
MVFTVGRKLTVTVILVGEPAQEPTVDVGVTTYTMLPALELLGLVKVWLIVEPELALAPSIPPVLVPKVHAKVLATLAVRLILGLLPEQILAVLAVVTFGTGFTVTLIVEPALAQPVVVFLTTNVPVYDAAPGLEGTVILIGLPGSVV